MAAHIPVDLTLEADQVKETLVKIGQYLVRPRNRRKLKAGRCLRLYDKQVEVGPARWHEPGDAFVLSIDPFDLNEAVWESWAQEAQLQGHYDQGGNLKRVYMLM